MTGRDGQLLDRASLALVPTMLSDAEIEERVRALEAILSYHGAPYLYTGRTRTGGVDCATLLVCGYGDAGIVDRDAKLPFYPPDFHQHRSEELYLNTIEQFAHRVERDPVPGDIALFQIGRVVSHSAVIIDWPLCIHAWSISGRVELVDAIKHPELGLKRFRGIWSVW